MISLSKEDENKMIDMIIQNTTILSIMNKKERKNSNFFRPEEVTSNVFENVEKQMLLQKID